MIASSLFALVLGGLATGAEAAPDRVVETLGPFDIGPAEGASVRVVAVYREFSGAPPGSFARALESWRVESASGTTLLEETFPVEVRPGEREFWAERGLWAGRVVGGRAPLLLVEIGELPSAPGSGATWRVFDLATADRVRELARFEQQGAGLLNERDRRGDVPLAEGRFLDFDIHFGYFSLVFRYELDPRRQLFAASDRCAAPVDVRRDAELASGPVLVRELPAPRAAYRTVDPTGVQSVELLEGCLDHAPSPDEPLDPESLDLWVRVRIDDVTGWVRPADLARLGILFAG